MDTNKLDKDPLKDVRKKRKEKRGEENGKIEDIVEAQEVGFSEFNSRGFPEPI